MSYNAVPTKSAGNTWSASENNTYVRDNFAAGVPDLFQAKGDLAVASGADAADRLAVGSANQVLTADSAQTLGVKWANNPVVGVVTTKGDLLAATGSATLARLGVGTNGYILSALASETTGLKWLDPKVSFAKYKRGTSQSISAATVTIVDFATSVIDTDAAVTTGGSWKYTVPAGKGGYFLVSATVKVEYGSTWSLNQVQRISLYKNGSLECRLAGWFAPAAIPLTDNILSGAAVVSLAAGDYVDVRVYATPAVTVVGDGDAVHISIVRLM